MVFIPLHVEKHRMSQEESSFLLFAFAVFTVGILFGALLSGYGTFPAKPRAGDNVAATALSTFPSTTQESVVTPQVQVNTADNVIPDTTSDVVVDEFATDNLIPFDEFFATALSEVRTEVETKTARTFVLGTEIERLKNESVTLVAAFEQNCGSWTDTCATSYKSSLDANNASYNRLAAELELLIGELDRARESERIILASQ